MHEMLFEEKFETLGIGRNFSLTSKYPRRMFVKIAEIEYRTLDSNGPDYANAVNLTTGELVFLEDELEVVV